LPAQGDFDVALPTSPGRVNTAHPIEELTKTTGWPLLVSAELLEATCFRFRDSTGNQGWRIRK
jgi:hypothetical protein